MDKIDRLKVIQQAENALRRMQAAAGYSNDHVKRMGAAITRLKKQLDANREAVHY